MSSRAALVRYSLPLLVAVVMLCDSACGAKSTPHTPQPNPQPTAESSPADLQWRAVLDAERTWLATLSPPPTSSRLPIPQGPADLLNASRHRISLFDGTYGALQNYARAHATEGVPGVRARFRLALYADIRLRFASMHSIEQFADTPCSSSPETCAALARAFRDEIAQVARRQAEYVAPADVYKQLQRDTATGAEWGGQALSVALMWVVASQPAVDPDVRTESHDLLGDAALHEQRTRFVTLLQSDRRRP